MPAQRQACRPAGRPRAAGRDASLSAPDAVIFLDVDGVLHSLYGDDLFNDKCCESLEKIVRASGAAIVLSSTWRTEEKSIEMVNALLQRRRLAPIYDRTADLAEGADGFVPREAEVCHWLDRHPGVCRWIAIDDMDLQSGPTAHAARMKGHFVHTDSNTGLTPDNADLAIKLLATAQSNGPLTPEKPPMRKRAQNILPAEAPQRSRRKVAS